MSYSDSISHMAVRTSASFWSFNRQGARLNKAVFRATKGRLGASFRGAPVLLLDHVGRRSGTSRTSPLIYLDNAPALVVVGSKGGSDSHPAWFHNLMAMTVTEVELPGGIHRRVRPRVASGRDPSRRRAARLRRRSRRTVVVDAI
jgi:deazaflavin-dependent oxidoreductase (nitroreductase family)